MIKPEATGPDLLPTFRRAFPPLLKPALDWGAYHGWCTHEAEHVLDRIQRGLAQLWMGEQSAIVTEIYTHPTGLRTLNNWLVGGELQEIKRMLDDIEQWGRDQGCHRQSSLGRKGWLRALDGYKDHGIRKFKDLWG